LIKPTLWLVWHVHMHKSLTHRSRSSGKRRGLRFPVPLDNGNEGSGNEIVTDHKVLPTPKRNFCSKILKLREPFAFSTSRKYTLFTQHNTTQHNTTQHNTTQHNNTTLPKIERKRKKTSLTHWKSDLIKLHFNLVPRSLQRTFEQFS